MCGTPLEFDTGVRNVTPNVLFSSELTTDITCAPVLSCLYSPTCDPYSVMNSSWTRVNPCAALVMGCACACATSACAADTRTDTPRMPEGPRARLSHKREEGTGGDDEAGRALARARASAGRLVLASGSLFLLRGDAADDSPRAPAPIEPFSLFVAISFMNRTRHVIRCFLVASVCWSLFSVVSEEFNHTALCGEVYGESRWSGCKTNTTIEN